MPRSSTAKSRQNVNGNSNATSTIAPQPTNIAVRSRTTVKREPGSATETVTEQVFHRKSERRRVARDIFLVFEEQPSTRRSRGSNKKQPKPKFGHLKVEDPIKPKGGLLRDIKNEPKCYLGDSIVNQTLENVTAKKKSLNRGTKSHYKVWSSTTCTSNSPAYTNVDNLELSKVPQEVSKSASAEEFQVARVNPIFLWAKQENTRIIEVRCEDYDKRNRIRLTKTSNGWRAIPRSDPTSSKILKLYTSPLIKVKRESNGHEFNHISQTVNNVVCIENKPIVSAEIVQHEPFSDPAEIGAQVNGIDTTNKQPTSKKSKKKKSKKRKRVFTCKKGSIKINATSVENSDVHHFNQTTNTFAGGEVMEKEGAAISINMISENSVSSANANKFPHLSKGILKMSSPFSRQCTEEVLLEPTYHTAEDDSSFQLCPKTGLFLRNAHIRIDEEDDVIVGSSCINHSVLLEKHKNMGSDSKHNSVEDNTESLEAKTRNLKDLLDDADLFQHCDDNANSDAELIDTLVKSSCENNLIQDNETSIKDAMDHLHTKNIEATPNDLGQLITEVSDPPKCLSFNEAGEIEALNCELFQPHAYIETFEKQPSTTITDIEMSTHTSSALQTMSLHPPAPREQLSAMADNDNNNIANIIEDSPKDLSYKKREEVCPPSESRSQCAVTSSSDIVKSPNLDETSVLASSSETLKNLILEQFMKLNTISTHQKEPNELEKQIEITNLNSIYSKCKSKLIETVVIDDDDSATDDNQVDAVEEPMKKRLRSSALPTQTIDEFNVKAKMDMMDKDPDPLTQLRLLIRNSQWKVPDPILVPKDRLSAVLASPAREIPLLITTRPELRLPEAFAYPEIIQNPNILVISMAQLEAILKNDLEVDKSKSKNQGRKLTSSPICKQNIIKNAKYVNDLHMTNRHQIKEMSDLGSQLRTEEGLSATIPFNNFSTSMEKSAKCSHIDSSLSSDINAATMAVLNQMLWLPYFGQISQDFMKSLKTSHSLTQKVASLLPFSGPKINGVQHLEETCDKSKRNQISPKIPVDKSPLNSLYANATLSSALKKGQTDELTLFQKIVQHQMQNVINCSQVQSGISEPSTTNHTSTDQSSQMESVGHDQLNATLSNNTNINLSKNQKDFDENDNNITDAPGKTYNLRSSIASRQSSDTTHYSNLKTPDLDNKPRLTCKSLSNLIDPELNQQQNINSSSTAIHCVSNVDCNFEKGLNGIKDQVMDNKHIGRIGGCLKEVFVANSLVKPNNPSSLDVANDLSKQKNKESNVSENGVRNCESSSFSTETNIPLWHPLFGSNSKSAYSSPWQWTTVTAAGE